MKDFRVVATGALEKPTSTTAVDAPAQQQNIIRVQLAILVVFSGVLVGSYTHTGMDLSSDHAPEHHHSSAVQS